MEEFAKTTTTNLNPMSFSNQRAIALLPIPLLDS